MNKKLRWITETAIMLALLVSLQALTKGFGQFVTGSCVNAILAIAALNDIDMERIILEKDRKASIKYHHDVNLEQFLQKP